MGNIELVYDSAFPKLNIPKSVLPPDGKPQSHHFLSTDGDNLIELAGRVCYDSACSTTKTRGTPEYHKHINEVKHTSVQGHLNLSIIIYTADIVDIINAVINRPGFITTWCMDSNRPYVALTYNVRCVNDWFKFGHNPRWDILYWTLVHYARKLAPLAVTANDDSHTIYQSQEYNTQVDRRRWLSFYISDVSRGLTHELVRHGYQTAISQRSTRYVDETDSKWCWHPILLKYREKLPRYCMAKAFDEGNDWYNQIKRTAQSVYFTYVMAIEQCLVADGIDKFTARKQARGAARGLLGNALSTELIWSANMWELKEVIRQRANDGADGEIRLLANKLYEIVVEIDPEYFKATTKPCPDGIGYGVYFTEDTQANA
jgi:flavin-dependent thymidylate synthase